MFKKIAIAVMLMTAAMFAITAMTGCPSTSNTENRIHVFNDSDTSIVGIYVSPTYASGWGGNFLDQKVLYPGGDIYCIDLEDDCYDILAVFSNGQKVQNQVCLSGGETIDWTLINAGKSAEGTEEFEGTVDISDQPKNGSLEIQYLPPSEDNPGEPKELLTQ